MQFFETDVHGAFRVALNCREDDRGFFARFFCVEELKKAGIDARFVQANNSLSVRKGTLRGLHYQLAPKAEGKLVRCLSGALFDVVLDLRPDSPTYKSWAGATLTADNREMLWVPPGCAHGFLTLEPRTEILYLVTEPYAPELERGVRFDDPAFKIAWPIRPEVVSDKDRAHADYQASGSV